MFNRKKIFKVVYKIATVTSSVVTIFGVFILVPQINLISHQLDEINAQPIIKINFNLATTTIKFGTKVSEPFDISLTVKNEGNRVASYWRGSIVFCKNINVINFNEPWIKEEDVQNQYLIESQKIIPPTFPGRLNFHSYTLDNIGNFQILVPRTGDFLSEKGVPIGQVTISGDYKKPTTYLVSLSHPKGFTYENLIQENGIMVADFLPILGRCFDIEDRTKNGVTFTNH